MVPFLDEIALGVHRKQNTVHTALLLVGMATLVVVSGYLLLGPAGIGWAAVVLGLLLVGAPRISPEMMMRMYRGQRVNPAPGDQLSEIVDLLTERSKLPARPALYVIPSMTLNAFATGKPEHAAIAITEGLLRRLTMREIVGVLAHEMSHIRNNDVWVLGVADALTRVCQGFSFAAIALAALNVLASFQGDEYVSWLAIALLYLSPLLSNLMQLGLSRAREYDADLEAAQISGDPLGLASALRRLEQHTGRMWEDVMLPVPGRRVGYPSLLRSHPATEERIRRLLEVSGKPLLPPVVIADKPLISLVGFGPITMRPRFRFPGLWF